MEVGFLRPLTRFRIILVGMGNQSVVAQFLQIICPRCFAMEATNRILG